MSTQPTNFSGLAGGNQAPQVAYAYTQGPEAATASGDYQQNTKGIRKPRPILPPWPPFGPVTIPVSK